MLPRFISSRTIIHVDLDAFFCAVEEQRDPTLRGQAFAVGGRPEFRGVVASCSYLARTRGVRSAMSMAAALRLCPNLIVVPSRHGAYRAVSQQVMALLRAHTPLLEQISIDEAFLDVTDLVAAKSRNGDVATQALIARELALAIQDEILRELGLSCSVGVASNKMVAKIATDCGKVAVGTGSSPKAICVVPTGEEAAFLAPLSVTMLWGVGPKMEERLTQLGITTIGTLAAWSQRDLARRFGKHGYELSQHAKGIDKREIVTERESKSISSETTFTRDVQDGDQLRSTLSQQARSVAAQLQKQKLHGSTVKIKLRWTDFTIVTRQMTLPQPTKEFATIETAAIQLLEHLWQNDRPVRLIGVGIAGLSSIRQLGLFDFEDETEANTLENVPENAMGEAPVETSDETSAEAAKLKARKELHERKRQQVLKAMAHLEERFGTSIVRVAAEFSQERKNLEPKP